MAEAMGVRQAKPEDFTTRMTELQKACGVYHIPLSNYGVTYEELPVLADNARETMGGLFGLDPANLTREDVIGIYQRSYR